VDRVRVDSFAEESDWWAELGWDKLEGVAIALRVEVEGGIADAADPGIDITEAVRVAVDARSSSLSAP